ncbi:tumor necrosis factor-like [Leptodactylus fuscus]|uniref:tumor necrosis factor-like n=1 Tax=Leptodactylus fuscus TaxID=238119 RepID=UPI003F4EEA02
MELTQVRTEEPLLHNVQDARRRTSCIHWLSVGSFVLLLGATTILALLHFKIIQLPSEKQDEPKVPEVLQIRNYLESVPQTQAMKGKRAAAHLIGKRNGNEIKWQGVSTNAFQDGSIKLEENSLRIEESGLYFVYTQALFTDNGCKGVQELTHSVLKRGAYDDESRVILKSTKSVCEVASKSLWTQPIYQGGLFKLEEGDVLSTHTTHVKFLDSDNGQVYFGILAV